MLALIASFLDPRRKGCVGISQADKNSWEDTRLQPRQQHGDKYNKPNTVCKHDIDKIYMQLLPLDNLDMCDEVYDHYYDQANGSEGVGAEDPETPQLLPRMQSQHYTIKSLQ